MRASAFVGRDRRSEGFALVLALLAMMLLTFLGLTLAVTTSTELQIATNYKWSQQALFNAETGIELGRRLLQNQDWSTLLPVARTNVETDVLSPAAVPGRRDYENLACDTRGYVGYGRVLVVDNPIQEISDISSLDALDVSATESGVPTRLQGTFTLWVRRALVSNEDLTRSDAVSNLELVLTSEGTAPYTGAATAFTSANRAVRTMEVQLSAELVVCSTRSAQQGASSSGAGFAACTNLDEEALTSELEYAESRGAAVGEGTAFTGE